ncbi:bifunctional metallophosphatase/5'-nucleotidase [Roseococcus sp. DSY-14]|uniref:bifunctional metallophosphatase/5'-nucleotidase n=1 Tax=Roseococcus sp. DSY-14 TaxID=3369650 RepID=UPI00387AD9F9
MLRRSLLAAPCLVLPARAQPSARVALLHLNDFHSRHEAITAAAAICRPGGDCRGGSARMAAAIRAARDAARAEGRAPLLLDGGDEFLGSLFFTHHDGLAEAGMQRLWGVGAMTLGNHEFDLGPAGLARYLEAVDFPVLAANVEAAAEPLLAGKLRPTASFRSGAARLVVAGLVTPDTPTLSSPGPQLRFTDPAEAASRAVWEARREGPATVVALSHLGAAADRRLAREVPGLDVILGGHSHTLIAPPEVVAGPDRPVLVAQAGAFGRWLGRLDLDLDDAGRVTAHAGGTRELTPDLPEDAEAAALVAELAAPLEAIRRRPAFDLPAALPADGCGRAPCALGEAVAEAMRRAMRAEIGWQNAGGLRAGLPAGAVGWGDVLTTLPFSNTAVRITLRGGTLREALEHALARRGGGFPQLAALRYAADGVRLLRAEVRDAAGDWHPLEPERAYTVATNNFLRRGGDGYAMFAEPLEALEDGPPVEDALVRLLSGAAGSPWRPSPPPG